MEKDIGRELRRAGDGRERVGVFDRETRELERFFELRRTDGGRERVGVFDRERRGFFGTSWFTVRT